eukprot:gene4309-4730_t
MPSHSGCLSKLAPLRMIHEQSSSQLTQDAFGDRLSANRLKSSREAFFRALQRRQEVKLSVNKQESADIADLLLFFGQSMKQGEVVSTLSSLAALKSLSPKWNPQTHFNILAKQVHRIGRQWKGEDLLLLLISTAKLGVNWSSMMKATLLEMNLINTALREASDKTWPEAVWALGQMDARQSSLPADCSRSILIRLEKTMHRLSSYTLASTFWALARMGYRWDEDFSSSLQSLVIQRISVQLNIFTPQQASKIIWSLGSLGVKASRLSILERLVQRVADIKRSLMGTASPSNMMLLGLAKMDLVWNEVTPELRRTLLDQFTRVLQGSNGKGISGSLWAVSSMGLTTSEMPPALYELVLRRSTDILPELSAWALTNVIWGFSKLGYHWTDLPAVLQQSFYAQLERLQDEFNGRDVSTLLWSLAEMDAILDTFPSAARTAILQAVEKNLEEMSSSELSLTIWGLSGGEASWDMLAEPVKWGINSALRRLSNNMTVPKEVANAAHGLSLLCFDAQDCTGVAYRGVHEAMLDIIRQHYERITSLKENEQIRTFVQYVKARQVLMDNRRIPASLLAVHSVSTSASTASKLEQRVMNGLKQAIKDLPGSHDFEVTKEWSGLEGIFPVDAAILRRGQVLVLLEVDGPHHYRHDGQLRRSDLLKQFLYRNSYPSAVFHRISYDEEEKVGADALGKELAAVLLTAARERDDVFGNAWKSFNNAFANVIRWGLRNDVVYPRSPSGRE